MTFEKIEEYRESNKHEDNSVVYFFDKLLNHQKNILLFNPLLLSTVDTSLSIEEQHIVILNELSEKLSFIYEYRNRSHCQYNTYMIYALYAPKPEDYRFIITQFTASGIVEIDSINVYELNTMVSLYYKNFFN